MTQSENISDIFDAFDSFCWGITAGAVFFTLALIPGGVGYAGLKCCGMIP